MAETITPVSLRAETEERYLTYAMSVYEALVRMAQPWVMRAKLVHGQGNFGSVGGPGRTIDGRAGMGQGSPPSSGVGPPGACLTL